LFVAGVGLTLAASILAVAYLRLALRSILLELCGTPQRAAFWAAFCNVTLVLTPLIFAMQYVPAVKPGTTGLVELATQFKWGLAGLLVGIVTLGSVLSRFIGGHPVVSPQASA